MPMKPTPGVTSTHKIFSYPLNVAEVPQSGLDISVEADAATLRALAVANGLPNIARLEAAFHVVPKGNHGFNVSGEMRATVTQTCGVSLESFESDRVEPIDVDFVPAVEASAAAAAFIGSDAADAAFAKDPPDSITDGQIDLGTLASEFLTLSLDPYPRKPGISYEPPTGQDVPMAADAKESPFSVLRKLKEGS